MKQIWVGVVSGYKVRIMQSPDVGCIVEAWDMEKWEAVDDDVLAAEVYMTAYLEARQTIAAIKICVNSSQV